MLFTAHSYAKKRGTGNEAILDLKLRNVPKKEGLGMRLYSEAW